MQVTAAKETTNSFQTETPAAKETTNSPQTQPLASKETTSATSPPVKPVDLGDASKQLVGGPVEQKVSRFAGQR